MLDPYSYRQIENVYKEKPGLALRALAHTVDHFENIGFPVRVPTIQSLAILLNSMQEGRFDLYMSELGGLTRNEHGRLLAACVRIFDFQQKFFPAYLPVLPLSVLMSCLCAHKKMLGINPNFSSVLELGPGCGYLSLFLRNNPDLVSYVQIEACESYYLLQNLINIDTFGETFFEHAFDPNAVEFWMPPGQMEVPPFAKQAIRPVLCEHFPWWKIQEVYGRKFDIVVSNANLLEFSPDALSDYINLISNTLKPDGAVIAQCCGAHIHGTPPELFLRMEAAGLRLLADPRINDIHNALWVREGRDPGDMVQRVFGRPSTVLTTYTKDDIIDQVAALV